MFSLKRNVELQQQGMFRLKLKILFPLYKINVFGSQIGSHSNSVKTKTLIVKDYEGLKVVSPGLEPEH